MNYFTTLNTTSSSSSGPCGASGTLDCRGADSAAELSRQTAKIVAALDILNPDIAGLVELQNSATDAAVSALVSALNAVKGSGTYSYIPTGIIGGDAIVVGLIYKPSIVTPINNFVVLNSSVNPIFIDTSNRPVLIQTFQQVSTGARCTVSVCHLKSKGSACTGDANKNDGQGNCPNTRRDAAIALINYLATDPTSSGDPDHLIVGDLNAYAKEDAISVLRNAGFTDLALEKVGNTSHSYLFDGQRGSLDYALASSSLLPQVVNATVWNINSDEIPIFDYNDGILETGEATFERESNAKSVYAPNQLRSSDHDPILVGLALKTSAPVKPPVVAPVKAPILGPVVLPVTVPVAQPITAPVTVPVAAPVKAPILAPVLQPVTVPVVQPITAPVTVPVAAPAPSPVVLPVNPPVASPVTPPLAPPLTQPVAVPVAAPLTPPVTLPVVPVNIPIRSPVVPVPIPVSQPVPVPVPNKIPVRSPTKLPTKAPTNIPVSVAPTIPATSDCGLFGLNFFCPRRGKCGFWRRFLNRGRCD